MISNKKDYHPPAHCIKYPNEEVTKFFHHNLSKSESLICCSIPQVRDVRSDSEDSDGEPANSRETNGTIGGSSKSNGTSSATNSVTIKKQLNGPSKITADNKH